MEASPFLTAVKELWGEGEGRGGEGKRKRSFLHPLKFVYCRGS